MNADNKEAMMANTLLQSDRELIQKVHDSGHAYILRFWDELSSAQREALLRQIEHIDFDLIKSLKHQFIEAPVAMKVQTELEPVVILKPPQTPSTKAGYEQARQLGAKILSEGKVATLLVAGGLGTRLGFDGPKGVLEVGPLSRKSLFQLHAEKLLHLNRKFNTRIPWYIMTSDQNDAATKTFFSERDFFGLNPDDVFFFTQGTIPALDPQGKLMLDAKDHIFVGPDGHGGVLPALRDSGALDDLARRGIEKVFYFQIDNVLLNMCDPVFLGLHTLKNAEMSAKVVAKRDPYEKVGVIGRLNGKVQVIEYSDLSREEMEARLPDGTLKYNGGSIAIHIFNLDFLEKEIRQGIKLPFHLAFKKVPYLDEYGQLIQPEKPNAYKFEMFIFDALKDAAEVVVLEVNREEEFSPIKNKSGDDSPVTAFRDLQNLYRKWLTAAGVEIVNGHTNSHPITIEISPIKAIESNELLQQQLPKKIASDFLLG
jgi:UDP-N-acetylglucosamine/UDP-N-acetylgalactosamine diphosphorylase